MTAYMKASLALCLTFWLCALLCSGLVLERRPRRIPQALPSEEGNDEVIESEEEENPTVERKSLKQQNGQLSPLMMKPTWKALYPFGPNGRREMNDALEEKKSRSQHRKRSRREEGRQKEQEELADILKDEEDDKAKQEFVKPKAKRGTEVEEQEVKPTSSPDFQDWLRREYYRNMAKSFASMRKKRDGSTHWEETEHETEVPSTAPLNRKRRDQKNTEKKKSRNRSVSFEEVTDNLRALEDALFLDALGTLAEDPSAEGAKKARIEADLSSAYDLETMRSALFRLRETLGGRGAALEAEDEMYATPAKKRSSHRLDERCPPLEFLTSQCSALEDLLPRELDGLRNSVLHSCNWHEVCYTCGSAYGLSVDACDSGFIQQSRPFCLDDAESGPECENPAPLLLVPLRSRRVFFKRSNPQLCLADPCLQNYLLDGDEL
ncbi:uncharacterized protein LOC129216913 [Uloborus diversus]|uniref:uncharacterized protein LOC129216913 n=1 Tax=Uloborus diversus TaxID=327109 RepID=UPI002408F4A3|nr:uncharacterized protein LOC129216913 [Uloborus diversus]